MCVSEEERKMKSGKVLMEKRKKVALVVHDNRKDVLEWVKFNKYVCTTRTM
jgi:hypothetical protein